MNDDIFKILEQEDDEGRCETCGTLLHAVARPISSDMECVVLMCDNDTCEKYHQTVVSFKRPMVQEE